MPKQWVPLWLFREHLQVGHTLCQAHASGVISWEQLSRPQTHTHGTNLSTQPSPLAVQFKDSTGQGAKLPKKLDEMSLSVQNVLTRVVKHSSGSDWTRVLPHPFTAPILPHFPETQGTCLIILSEPFVSVGLNSSPTKWCMPRHLGWDKKDKEYQKQRENLWKRMGRVVFVFVFFLRQLLITLKI